MAEDLFGDRLLVIDDQQAFGSLVKKIAQNAGFEVVVTDDPALFLNTARLWHPTVIMLDLKIPGSDGIQLLRTLAGDKCAAHIIVTSGSDGRILEAAIQLGRERGLNMSEVLPKPLRAEALRHRLSALQRIQKPALSADLAQAIAADGLFLEYQPKLDFRLARITGVEALVRWHHPVHRPIPPDQFVPLAEEIGLIKRLTGWVVDAAAAQAAQWRDHALAIEVAVNISARDVEDFDLPDRLEQRCRDRGLDPACMTLELTETGAMREAVQMMDILTRLRLKGFKLSIDDFGTGYSSLALLQRMPFSELKIDRCFVGPMLNNQGCRAIVEIVIDLARKLGLRSVAEGVEHEAALNALIEMGCDAVQGHYLSRPVAAGRIADLLGECGAARGGTPPRHRRGRAMPVSARQRLVIAS